MLIFPLKRRLFQVLTAMRQVVFAILLACGVLTPSSAQQFTSPVIVTTGHDPTCLQAADFTGKGMPDLLALDGGGNAASGPVRILSNSKGTFSLSPAVYTAGSSILAMPSSPGMLPDLYWTSVSGNQATLLRANAQADGSYLPGTPLVSFPLSGSAANPPLSLATGGLHAGYANSVVIADEVNDRLYTALPNPDGTYAIVPVSGQPGLPLDPNPVQMLTADINGDGLPDLLIAVATGVQIFLAQGTADNFTGFAAPMLHPSMGVQSMALADMDGDGHVDLVQELGNGQVDIYHGNPDGSFAATSEVGAGANNVPLGKVGYVVGVADLNADGIPDLVLANTAGSLTVLQGTGSRNFQTAATYSIPANATQFVFTDLNGDGKPDIAFNVPQGVAVMFSTNAVTPTGQLTASPEPSIYGSAFTLTLQFAATSTPTGTVNFSVDGAAVGSGAISNNQATYTISAPTYIVGQHAIEADYEGDSTYSSATFTGTHNVQGLATVSTISDLVTPIYYGQEIGYTNGIDAVVAAEPAPSDPSPPNATVDGGLIYVYLDGQLVCSLTVGAVSSTGGPTRCNDANFMGYGAGVHTMVAAYQGNQYYAPSQSMNYSVQVLPDDTATTVVTSQTPAPVGTAVTFTATVTAPYATPVGTVQFYDGTTLLGTAALSAGSGTFIASASYTMSALATGTHSITAVYVPMPIPAQDPPRNFNPSQSSQLTQVIRAISNSVLLTSSLNPSSFGQAVTFTSTVDPASASSTATVTFSVDGQTVATVMPDAQGIATYTTAALAVGSHDISVVYRPNTKTPNLTGASLTQVVNPGAQAGTDFSLTVTPNPVSIGVGNTGLLTVTVTEPAGFQEPVQLSCSGLPFEATCTFASSTIAAGGGTTQLVVHPEAPHNCSDSNQYFIAGSSGRFAMALGAMMFVLFGLRRRRILPAVLAAALCVLPMLGGCGWGHCTDLGTRPGTYTFTVTGAATGNVNISHTQTVVLHAVLTEPTNQ